MAKVLIDKNQPLTRGDIIELHFAASGMNWIKATQIVLIEREFEGREDWEIINFETPVDLPNLLIITVRVLGGKRPAGETPGATGSWLRMNLVVSSVAITVAVIAASIIGVNIVGFLTLRAAYQMIGEDVKKVIESPTGKLAVAGTGIGLAAAGIAALILIFLPKK